MDYYSILGVSSDATQEQIKRAYRDLVKAHHPDQGGDAELFKQINEAYETLKDPDKRHQYDNPRSASSFNFDESSFEGHPFEDLFASMFQQRRQMKNSDVRVRVDIDLADCLTEKSVIVSYRLGNGNQETVTVDIPAGVDHGNTIKYQGLGDNSIAELPRGNLYVVIKIRKSANWSRNGNDLITTQKVNVLALLTGCAIIIKTLDNKSISLNVPQGTQPDTTFSIKDYGIPDVNTGVRGNLYIKVKADIPKISNTDILEQLENIKTQLGLKE